MTPPVGMGEGVSIKVINFQCYFSRVLLLKNLEVQVPFHLPWWIQRGFSSCKKGLLLKQEFCDLLKKDKQTINQKRAYRINFQRALSKWLTPELISPLELVT